LDKYADSVENQQRKLEGAVEILVEIQKKQARRASSVAILERLVHIQRARVEKLEAQLDMAREALATRDQDNLEMQQLVQVILVRRIC
jgi:hypothetical protein